MLKGKALEGFVELFDGDEKAATEWLEANVDRTHDDIAESRQIARAGDDDVLDLDAPLTPVTPTEETTTEETTTADPLAVTLEIEVPTVVVEDGPEDEDEEEDDDGDEIVLDDAAIAAVAEQVMETEAMRTMFASIESIRESIETVTNDLTQMRAANIQRDKKTEDRIKALEADDDTKHREWKEDLPRSRQTRMTYRPRDNADSGEDVEETYAEIANATADLLEE